MAISMMPKPIPKKIFHEQEKRETPHATRDERSKKTIVAAKVCHIFLLRIVFPSVIFLSAFTCLRKREGMNFWTNFRKIGRVESEWACFLEARCKGCEKLPNNVFAIGESILIIS